MDSPFSEHFDTSYIASDDEIPRIKALIQQKLDVIGNIDKEIEDVKISLAALEGQRDANKTFIQKHRALISPIKRLPPDILTAVFLTCLPAVEHAKASLTCNHPAVVLSHVCRQWRQLSLDTPMLWSRIRIILPYLNYEPYHHPQNNEESVDGESAELYNSDVQRLHDMAAVWLTRSKDCPLTIFVEAFEGGYIMPQVWTLAHSKLASVKNLVDMLLSESRRWQQVRFRISMRGSNPESQFSRLLYLPPEDVPILHKAKIMLGPQYEPIEPPNLQSQATMGISHGQALQSLALICPKVFVDSSLRRVNWAALTELVLHLLSSRGSGFCLTVEEVLHFLEKCPNLRRCNVALVNNTLQTHFYDGWTLPAPDPLPPPGPRPIVRLPHLHSLVLLDRNTRTDRLASALDLPSLSSLKYDGPDYRTHLSSDDAPPYDYVEESVWYDFPLLGWVQRFGRTITNIDFQHIGVAQRAVELALEELPNLVSLTIRAPFLESLKPDSPTLRTWSSIECDSFLKRLTPEAGGIGTHWDSSIEPRSDSVDVFRGERAGLSGVQSKGLF
ncbi:hypothetical protein MD484_g3459, partial [Candolleomyces efflorescens]